MTRHLSVSLALLLLLTSQQNLYAGGSASNAIKLPANNYNDFEVSNGTRTCIRNKSSYDAEFYLSLSRRSKKTGDHLVHAHKRKCFTWGNAATVRVDNRSGVPLIVENTTSYSD